MVYNDYTNRKMASWQMLILIFGKKGTNMEKVIIALIIVGTILNIFIVIQIVDMVLMGCLHFHHAKNRIPDSYIIGTPNRTEKQGEFECAAFSSAYLLRHLGTEIGGFDLYDKIPDKFKMTGGMVYPKGVRYCLAAYGVKSQYCRGNIRILKEEVAKGVPVIVMMKIREDKNWLHYVPVVGYDNEYIYIAESYAPLINCDEKLYNRKVEVKSFERLWDTKELKMPLYSKTYYRILCD